MESSEAKTVSEIRARRDRSSAALRVIENRHVPKLTPNHKLLLAQRLLNEVLDDGITYADFESAQAVERYTRKARNALRGLSLG